MKVLQAGHKLDRYIDKRGPFENFIVKRAHSPRIKNFLQQMRSNEDMFQKVLLGCTILANQINNIWYLSAGLNNKKMPLTQRTYDASTQIAGIPIQLGLITLTGITINKYSGKWASKLFNQLKQHPEGYRLTRIGFRSFLTIFVAYLIPMRIVSPFLQAPLAKWIDNKYFKSYREKYIQKHPNTLV